MRNLSSLKLLSLVDKERGRLRRRVNSDITQLVTLTNILPVRI